MASWLETSQLKGLDIIYDVCCIICEDDGIHKEGRFHCQKCSKYLCHSCVLTHNKFHKHHSVTAKRNGGNWPVNQTFADELPLELCEEHTTEKLTMFCEDDETLLCHVCHHRNHKQCIHVRRLSDKLKSSSRPLDEAQMKTSIASCLKRLEDMVKIGETNIMSLQTSYENVLEEIVDTRILINGNLDRLQQHTERKLEELHSTLKNSLENRRKHCVDFITKINGYNIESTHKQSTERSFIMYRKCLDRIASGDIFLRKATTNVTIEFQQNKDLEQLLAACTEFGSIASRVAVSHHSVDPNKNVIVKNKSHYNVRTATDAFHCNITGICESANGEFVIADSTNECVKLMDQAFNLIEQIQLPTCPWSMCQMSSNEMALAVSDGGSVNEIHFVRVDKRRIVKLNLLQLNHLCYGIANHQGDLFVTSHTTVCQYTMDGRLVKTLYENKSGGKTVLGVGVRPDGKMIYVAESPTERLLTLTRDGEITATLQYPAFTGFYIVPNLHVAATGHVLVLGARSVSQVDPDGKTVLNTIKLDMCNPRSVYYNEDTSKMIVGFCASEIILEFKTKLD